jgi:hypothetical protein
MATEYNDQLADDLHSAWMAMQTIRAGLPYDGSVWSGINHERWLKLAAAMRVITDLSSENFAFLEQKVHALTESLKENR